MTPAPYYEDDAVTLYEGRCEDILPTLTPTGSVHLLTDPPYFQVKDDDWDNQWTKAAHFLDWMGEWLDLAKPHLTSDASVWVFASPELTSEVERIVAERFRVLNSVRWVKEHGWHKKAELEAARRFLTAWEGIVFAEQQTDPTRLDVTQFFRALHKEAFAPVGRYFREERERAGWEANDLEFAIGRVRANGTRGTGIVRRWEEGDSLPPRDAYAAMREALGSGSLPRPYQALRDEWEALSDVYAVSRTQLAADREAFEVSRRPFTVRTRHHSTDVWQFDNVAAYPGKHPCEKPLELITHMIETTTRPGDTILDPFAGSGALLDAARKTGRRAVGIEMDPKWCRRAAQRLGQQTFDFGEMGA